MQKCALSGREFIVLLLGFGCTVGAVASSRTAGSERGRRRLILALPYICLLYTSDMLGDDLPDNAVKV